MIRTYRTNSSQVTAVGYTPETNDLFVRFEGGDVYQYPGVPVAHVTGLLFAPSIGKYFGANLRTWPGYKKLPATDERAIEVNAAYDRTAEVAVK